MNKANIGKKLLYGFAGALFAPVVFVYVVGHIVDPNILPAFFFWSLIPLAAVSFWFSYKFTLSFEKVFIRGLIAGTSSAVQRHSIVRANTEGGCKEKYL